MAGGSRHWPLRSTGASARAAVIVALLCGILPASLHAQQEGETELSLVDAVRQAMAEDPGVEASRAGSDAAAAGVGEAMASWFPTVGVRASTTRYQEPMIVNPIHDFQPGQTPPFDRTLIQAGATLSYTLFDGGSRVARVRTARSRAGVAGATLDEAKQLLVARVVTTYLTALSQQLVLQAHDRRITALESELSRVRQRRDAGQSADIDVLRVEAALAGARADRVPLATKLDLSERDLARLIGGTVDQTRAERLVPVAEADSTIEPRDVLVARALQVSPAVGQARGEVEVGRANQTLARSLRWPKLDLFGAYLDNGSINGDHQAEWNVGVQFSYPLFTGGAVSRGIARADAMRRAADAQLRRVELEVAHDADRALSAVEEADARVVSLKTAAARFAEVVRIEKLRLEAGAGTETDYLSAEAELLAARAGLAEAQYAAIAARVELARVSGALDLGWLERNVEARQ